MIESRLEKQLEEIKSLSTFPVVASNVVQLTQNPKASALEVGEAISQDPALSSSVLRVANSAFYGFPRKIATIHSATVVLGFANIRNIVLTASITNILPSGPAKECFDIEQFWKHSLACGIASKLLAKHLGIQSFEESFIWGLLHDFGKIVLATHFTEEFTKALQVMKEDGIHLREAEEKILGGDHAEVGGMVADKWNLPPALIKSIRFHHDPPMANESMRMAAIVHAADILCRAIGLGNGADSKVPEINEESWKLLNMDKVIVKKLLAEIEHELVGATTFLSIVK